MRAVALCRGARTASHATIAAALSVLLAAAPATAQAPADSSWGVRLGVGTDASLGIAYGGGINYRFPSGSGHLEIGPMLFFNHSEETTEEIHIYEEQTDLLVLGVMANFLFGYSPGSSAPFLVAGLGLAGINVTWEERSETDLSLGTPLPEGGSMQSEDATAGGTVLNIGAGFALGRSDLRIELPVIVIAAAPTEANAIVPTLTVTYGIRF